MYFECLIQMLANIVTFNLHFIYFIVEINFGIGIHNFTNYLNLDCLLDNNLYKLIVFYHFIFSFEFFRIICDYYISFHIFLLHQALKSFNFYFYDGLFDHDFESN
jgi:hypothetical protein